MLRILRTELKVAMQQIGAPSLRDLKGWMVLHVQASVILPREAVAKRGKGDHP